MQKYYAISSSEIMQYHKFNLKTYSCMHIYIYIYYICVIHCFCFFFIYKYFYDFFFGDYYL